MAKVAISDTSVALIAAAGALVFGRLTPDTVSWVGYIVASAVIAVLVVRQMKRNRAER